MTTFPEWLPPAAVGATFTTIGLLKVYGLRKGVVGGGGKPISCRLLGRCPGWSKQLHMVFVLFFLGIGVVNLAILLTLLLKS
jgi:tellurite resistance protein TehA-like permease